VLGVRSIVVELDAEILAGGLCLIDTPGLGSTHVHNSEATMRFVPRADAALVVLAADQPLGMAERELVARTAEFAAHPAAARAPRRGSRRATGRPCHRGSR
jgi:hypothetical protein